LIHVKALITGESDISPITTLFEYDNYSEQIFLESIKQVKNKLAKNMMINFNETILLYCYFIVSETRDGKSAEHIEKNASRILSPHNVMIGVPESIQKMNFEASIDEKSKINITFDKPIPITDYLLIPKN